MLLLCASFVSLVCMSQVQIILPFKLQDQLLCSHKMTYCLFSGFGEKVATAKEMAAREGLKKIFGTEEHMKPVNFKLEGIPKPGLQTRYQISAS